MINKNEVVRIGTITKTHGVNGEMSLTVPATLEWTDDLDCLVCSMDGILVPFWLDSIREKSTWKNREIIVIENNSTDEETFRYYKELEEDPRIIAYTRENEQETILVLANLSGEDSPLELPAQLTGKNWELLFSGRPEAACGLKEMQVLEAWQSAVFQLVG